jgi:heterodisulfide reductase subunit C
MNELKPCRCGSNRVKIVNASKYAGLTTEYWRVNCLTCGMRTTRHTSVEEAVKDWNNRPIEDQLRAENERLKAALEMVETITLPGGNIVICPWCGLWAKFIVDDSGG